MNHTGRSICLKAAAIVALALVLLVPAISMPAGKRSITETDLFRFVWIADPQISPDGSRIAFVKVWVNLKADRYENSLCIVSSGGTEPARQLTAGPRDLAPRWSPDGKHLAFVRAAEKEGKPQSPQINLLSMEGGEARALTDLPRGAGAPEWSPDGKSIAFTSSSLSEDFAKKPDAGKPGDGREAASSKGDGIPPHESDVRVITRAVYRSNGAGYSDPKRHEHIWIVAVPDQDAESPKPKQLTTGQFDEWNPTWSPDGARVYFTSNRVLEPYYEPSDADLYAVSATGGEITRIASIDGVIGDFTFSNDGKRIGFRGVLNGRPEHSYNQPDLFVAENKAEATPINLTVSYDFDIGGGIDGDQRSPRGGSPGGVVWSKDDRFIFTLTAEHGRANLRRVDAASGKVDPVTSGDHEIMGYSATPDAARFALLISTPTSIGDLFVFDTGTGKMTQVTRVNEELLSQLNLTAPEEFWYQGFDGREMQGWIQKPPDFDPVKKYPMILEVHGGPHLAYGYTFTHEFQWMAAKGYVVLYTNPRGSTSYGQDFGNIIQYHYPGDDYKDLMAGVDEVIKKGYIDAEHLGVTGGSGGGVLTNWTVTHTKRFAAAVSQRSIADWAGFWYTADFALFKPSWFRGAPWEDPADFAARSPITYVKEITTPMMFIEGEADYRTPPADGGEQLFRALKYLRKPTAMVRFPDESHELSRSGKPWHRVERLQHIGNWFDKYLQGKAIDLYDLR